MIQLELEYSLLLPQRNSPRDLLTMGNRLLLVLAHKVGDTVSLKSEHFEIQVPLACFHTCISFQLTFLSGWNALYAASFAANLDQQRTQ
jgi:hypothetical protein